MKFEKLDILYIYVRRNKKNLRENIMALLEAYNINAMATHISRDFYINDDREGDKSYVLMDEMRLFAIDLKSRVTFISRTKE